MGHAASALNDLGIVHIAPHRRRPWRSEITCCGLLERLFGSRHARLQQATILLLLTHPQAANDARAAIDSLSGDAQDRAMRRYVAAAAMQRMVRTRIALQLGPEPDLAPAFLTDLALPPLEVEYGKLALIELARQEASRYGYDAWGTYRSLLDLFLAENRRAGWGRVTPRGEALLCASGPTAVV